MILYLYKLGTNTPALTIKNARSYTADSVTDEDGAVYRPLAEGYELSGKADCSETLRADYRAAHPTQETRLEELEELRFFGWADRCCSRPGWRSWRRWWRRCCSEVRAYEYGCGATVPCGTAESGAGRGFISSPCSRM